MQTNDRSRIDGCSNLLWFVLFISTLHMYQIHLAHTDEQYIDIDMYIDSKSLLIFTFQHVCSNSIDDDDDDKEIRIYIYIYLDRYSTKNILKNKRSNEIYTTNNLII